MNEKWWLNSKTNALAFLGVVASIVCFLVPFESQIQALLGPHWAPIVGLTFSIGVAVARNIKSNTTLSNPKDQP